MSQRVTVTVTDEHYERIRNESHRQRISEPAVLYNAWLSGGVVTASPKPPSKPESQISEPAPKTASAVAKDLGIKTADEVAGREHTLSGYEKLQAAKARRKTK